MKPRPTEVNIIGIRYTIEYVENASQVDIFNRKSLWGQIDPWTRSIRIYDNGNSDEDVWQTILHEVVHGIGDAFHIDELFGEDANERTVDMLARAFTDVLFRNNWLTLDQEEE